MNNQRTSNSPTVSAGEQKTHIAAGTACPDSVPAPPVTPALRSESRGTWPFCRTPEFPDIGTPAEIRWLFAVAKLGRKRRNFAAGFATDAPMLTGYVRVSTDDFVPMWVFCSGADTVGELGDPGLFRAGGQRIWPKKAILGSAAWL